MNKTIRTAIAAAAVGGVLLATSPASANLLTSEYTGIGATEGITVSDTSAWRMSGSYDAQIADGVLRISNAVTSGSFGDQLFSPELAVGAVENVQGEPNTFHATFTLKPVALQPGLRITVSPDNGAGGRAGFLAIEHTKQGMTLSISGSNGGGGAWPSKVVAAKLDPTKSHNVEMKLVKVTDTKTDDANDTFAVRVDTGAWVTVRTFEAYYNATGEAEYPTDTLLFRVSGTAVPSMATSDGLLINAVNYSTS